MRRAAWVAGAVLLVLVAHWAFQAADMPDTQASASDAGAAPVAGAGQDLLAGLGKDGFVPPAQRTAAQWQTWLSTQSSLRGTQLDGTWGEMGPKGLVPSRALRLRFDQLMTTLGELTPAELRAMVLSLAERDLGAGASAVMAMWDRYVALINAPLSARPDPDNPEQWLALLREQQALRRQTLGEDWAKVFFQDEEALLQATVQKIQQARQGKAVEPEAQPWEPAPTGISDEQWQAQRRQALGADAAERLAALDRQDADWAQRLSQAREAAQRLQTQTELSTPQRQAALQQWLNERFTPEEQVRVKALLGL